MKDESEQPDHQKQTDVPAEKNRRSVLPEYFSGIKIS